MIFTTEVYCKKYTAHYLRLKYGEDIDIRKSKFLYSQLIARLGRGSYKLKYDISPLYSERLKVIIGTRHFYNKGWQMTGASMISFNKLIEYECKYFMYLEVHKSICLEGITAKQAIINFQIKYGFSEDIWAYDSIWQEFNRKNRQMETTNIKFIKH